MLGPTGRAGSAPPRVAKVAAAQGGTPAARVGGEKQKAVCNTCACDTASEAASALHFSNLFREEVEEHNMHHRGNPVVDQSEELIGVTYVFLRWYKLYPRTTPAKTAANINVLRSLPHR
jgi:hypothetical protein